MCVHLYEILAFYIFNFMVGSEELSPPYRIDSMFLMFNYVCFLRCNYMEFKLRTDLKAHRQEIHEEEIDMQMDIAMGA